MIELNSLTKRYGRKGAGPDALRAVTATIPQREVWAVVGPNGAGKSTLLSLVLGFIRPTSGKVLLAGAAPRDYVRDRGAAYLPERFRVPDDWTVRAALRLFARLDGAAGDVDSAVARLGLESVLDRKCGELSRGMLQRLGLAQALLAPRELVVLDEPTEGLDPIWRIRLRELLHELRTAGATVLLASHDLAEVERMADRVLVLENGGIRTVLDTHVTDEAVPYRITLRQPHAAVDTAFPAASMLDEASFTVLVSDANELSQRLGALLAAGAVVTAVEPARQPLEQRVRDTLSGET